MQSRQNELLDFLAEVDATYAALDDTGVLEVEEIVRNLAGELGPHVYGRAGLGLTTLDYRPYVAGEDRPEERSLRHLIEDHEVIKVPEAEEQQSVILWRDPMAGRFPDYRRACDIELAALGTYLSEHEENVSVLDGDEVHRFSAVGHSSLDVNILAGDYPDLTMVRPRSTAVFWGHFYDLHLPGDTRGTIKVNESSATLRMLEDCLERNVTGYLIKMIGPKEVEFFTRPTDVIDSSDRPVGSFSSASRGGWQNISAQEIASLGAICQDHGFRLILQRTDAAREHSLVQVVTGQVEEPQKTLPYLPEAVF